MLRSRRACTRFDPSTRTTPSYFLRFVFSSSRVQYPSQSLIPLPSWRQYGNYRYRQEVSGIQALASAERRDNKATHRTNSQTDTFVCPKSSWLNKRMKQSWTREVEGTPWKLREKQCTVFQKFDNEAADVYLHNKIGGAFCTLNSWKQAQGGTLSGVPWPMTHETSHSYYFHFFSFSSPFLPLSFCIFVPFWPLKLLLPLNVLDRAL